MTGALLTVAEVAKRWRVNRRTVIRMLARNEIDGLRIGGQIRVRETSVEDYEATHTTTPPLANPRREEAWS